jgi:hypothetical protein
MATLPQTTERTEEQAGLVELDPAYYGSVSSSTLGPPHPLGHRAATPQFALL